MNVTPRRLVTPIAPLSSTGTTAAPMMSDTALLSHDQSDALIADKPVVRLRLIGQMEAWTLTAESILPTGRKTRALLAILALSAPRPVLRGRLAEMLWSRRPEEQARASLRQEIHRLLDALGPVGNHILSIHRDHLTLRPGTVWVDVEEVLRASPGKPAALSLLDGDLLEDLDGVDPAFDNWLAAERERLRDRARVLAEQLLRDQSDPELTIPAAQQLLAIDRSHEGAWRALMRAYAQRGERGMALQAYERCRIVLADQLDAHPSDDTQRLAADIRATVPAARGTPQISRPEPRHDSFRLPLRPSLASAPASAEAMLDRLSESLPHQAAAPPAPAQRQGARLGVLPMQVSGAGPSEQGFATMLAEEITATLARNRTLSLVSSAALARTAITSRDEAMIGRAFMLDYLLDGTLQRNGERLRVSLRLLDLRGGTQIVWAERFDRQAPDLFGLQDEIAQNVAARMEPTMLALEAERVTNRPNAEPSSQELTLRAFAALTRPDRAQYSLAQALLTQAIATDPGLSAAHSWAALLHLATISQGWSDDVAADSAQAVRLAERAVMLDAQDARALTIAGHVRAMLQHRLPEAMVLHERALTLNPSLALAWTFSALTHAYCGQLDEAASRAAQAHSLAPHDPLSFLNASARVLIALLQRDYAAAIAIGCELGQVQPAWADGARMMLAAQGLSGTDSAHTLSRLLALAPQERLSTLAARQPFQRPGDWEHLQAGLRSAGLPD
ncbi:MAG: BTAD domain-containing putative transcriptional regulator [Acetobacteraceae bacterium]|nr:BTAD domain-containing putative transcriptional regulator [Acetobacteraceae bacterium]